MPTEFNQVTVEGRPNERQPVTVRLQNTRPPVSNLRFIMGAPRWIKTVSIIGNNPPPDVTFDPPATQAVVTNHFLDNPVASSPADEYTVTVINETDKPVEIEIVVKYDP